MLSRLTRFLSGSSEPAQAADFYQQRLAIYEQELDQPEHSFADAGEIRIDIHAFGRDFVPDCEEGSDKGYVLLTNGMSERRLPQTDRGGGDAIKPRAELM
ncbi:hypothetical protein [Bradyrhizobium liaoningense]|uniref:hypothetical protein n=1 Tax=Bradyrhizobium liaoningense TaxID=43992 RepID=UPI002010EA3B|nr:hypothetical protein [Bradyrhizobium liaoningense]